MSTISILGGGISGLSTAYYLSHLKNSNIGRIVLYEASDRIGGWINTEKQPTGTYYEIGPRSLRAAGIPGANTIALAHALGLEKDITPVTFDHPSTKFRMISVGGKLHKLPSSLAAMFKKSAPFSKPIMMSILNDLRTPKLLNSDESLYSFVHRRFGHEVAVYLIDPISRGVFAGNARDLSIKCLAKTIHDYEQQYGGVIKGAFASLFKTADTDEVLQNPLVLQARKDKWAAWSLNGGIDKFHKVLEKKILSKGIEIKKNVSVNTLELNSKGGIDVCSTEGKLSADHVFSCLPANVLTDIVAPVDEGIKKLLNTIPYVTVSVINLEYDSLDVLKDEAFGYLVPSSEPNKVLGVIFDTCTFPQGNKTIFTVMMGGYWFESLFGKNPTHEHLLKVALDEMKGILGVVQKPTNYKVSVLRDCIPQYTVGHSQNVEFIRKILSTKKLPLTITGNAYDGVGINDTILSAKRSVNAINKL